MFNTKIILLFIYAIFVISEAGVVDQIKPCGWQDESCIKNNYQYLMKIVSETGDPENNVPKYDPYTVTNSVISVFGAFDVNIPEAVITGIKDCTFETFKVDMNLKLDDAILICPAISVKAKYKIGSSPIVKTLLGNDISGEGDASVDIENIKIHILLPFKLVQRDGKIYFVKLREGFKYEVELLGKLNVKADKIELGGQDITPLMIGYVNQNSKNVIEIVTKNFGNTGLDIMFESVNNFFGANPVDKLISEDLSSYIDS